VSDPVKPRGGRTRATRRKIIDAATELFVLDGYSATTLERIASRSGVAVQTVYFHFGNKSTVLKEAVDVAAVGDDEPVAMLERPWLERARAEPDPHQVIALWTSYGRDVLTRVGPIMKVVRDAAAVDPAMAEQWATNEAQTASAFRVLAEQLDAMDVLRVQVDEAVAILCALSGLDVYLVLAARGWTPERWERFVVDSLTHALLRVEGDRTRVAAGGRTASG
jgi:AcrR family transcriptional regulator